VNLAPLLSLLLLLAPPTTVPVDLRDNMTEGEALHAIAEMPEYVQRALVAGEQARRRAIKDTEEYIGRLRAAPQSQDSREAMKKAKADLEDLKSRSKFYPARFLDECPVGSDSVGSLPVDTRVFQVVDGSQVILRLPNRQLVWMKGTPTDGMSDGATLVADPYATLIQRDTKQYDTAAGTSSTLFVLQPFNMRPYWNRPVLRAASQLVDRAKRKS
jgi:hypothetical protein